MKIVYVSDLIEKGRWRLNTPFHLKAAEASETKSVDKYFVIVGHLKGDRFVNTKIVRAAFCLQKFLQLSAAGVENIVKIENHDVYYKSIVNHPDAGYIEVDRVQEWRDYIRLRPEIIEFAINGKSGLLCYESALLYYEEYQ